MIQREWTYQDTNSQQHKIRLLHAPAKGYVVLLYNDTVLALELEAQGSTEYSFYVGEELCYCKISQDSNGAYAYIFGLNRVVNSPINSQTKQRKKEHFWQKTSLTLLFTISFSLVIGFTYFGYQQYNSYQLNKYGVDCFAKAIKIDARESAVTLFCDGKSFVVEQEDAPSFITLGDAFHVKFLKSNIKNYKVDFSFPSPITQARYNLK